MLTTTMRDLFALFRYRFILESWRLAKLERWAARHPHFHRCVNLDETSEDNDATILPVQQVIAAGENVVLPYQILQTLVSRADKHLILGRCPCRHGENCAVYPQDLGCLFLGQAVNRVPPGIGTHTDSDGAMAHVRRALELNLLPMILHARFDAALLGLPYHQMLAVCFCCPCCCTVQHHLCLGPSTFDDTIHRLPGLSATVGRGCIACGACHAVCPVNAIIFAGDVSVIDQVRCKGCGRCAAVCPKGAPQLHLDPSVDLLGDLLARIRARTSIGL